MNLFIHHRDIRISDNTTLLELQKQEKSVTPIFIFPPEQIDRKKNKYFSDSLVQFMCESLVELNKKYKKMGNKMYFYEGDTIKILESILKKNKINSIGFNLDYSPYAKKRDKKIIKWCKKNKIKVIAKEDMLLVNILEGKTLSRNSGEPYKVFTPYMKFLRSTYKVDKPKKGTLKLKKLKKVKEEIKASNLKKFYIHNDNLNVKSGRKEAKKKLKLVDKQKKYDEKRNILEYKTTHLSAYINLGVLSIREVYHYALSKLGRNNGIINELYWRDFYYNVLHFFPKVVGNSFKEKYDKIKWNVDSKGFKKWCEGKTGFPVVDAAMRQMNETGYMHNRARMIVASFLTKDLLIDWRKGEKYFATKLQDYNISANNGGWQWAAGTGTDSQPYFRIFNPWSQSEKFDPECVYIKKWCPELKGIPNKHIHKWDKFHGEYKVKYPDPMLDHSEARKKTLAVYKKYLN